MARILLAEDEPRIAAFITRGLQAHEFTVSATADGQEALNWALFGDYDLLVSISAWSVSMGSRCCGDCGAEAATCPSSS